MVSLPEPVVIVLAEEEPVTVKAELRLDASMFSKFVVLTLSPVVWSDPAATARLMAVVPPAAASNSVSVPVPPSIEVSVPRYVTVSLPPPALMTSAPPAPSMVSLPEPPVIVLAEEEPVMVTAEDSAEASTFWKLVTLAESPLVWSALPRLTVAAALITSVLVPAPPSIEVSVPR